MSSHIRLKQHISSDFRNNRFILDVQSLIDENEKYRKAYASLKSCQHIAGVQEETMLANKISELLKESEILQNILNSNDRSEILSTIERVKKERNPEN